MAKAPSSSDLPNIDTSVAVVDTPTNGKPAAKVAARAKADPNGKRGSKAANPAPPADEEDDFLDDRGNFITRFLNNSAGWMLSLIVHMVLIIVLALWVFPIPKSFDTLLAAVKGEDISDEIVDVPEVDFSDVQVEVDPEQLDIQPETEVIEEQVSFSPFNEEMAAAAPVELSDFGLSAAPDALTANINAFDGNQFEGRGHASRSALVRAKGGSGESEEAVEAALSWLAAHQNRDGTWHLDHTGGECQGQCGNPGDIENSLKSATALALLPFLGAGQTRYDGKYKDVVGRGLDALVRLGEKPRQGAGASWADGGTMYAHGLASIALCEAYGMTGESQLALPAQAAIDYIVSSQNPNDGGWRYTFQQAGDTSVVGWQIMALKSAHLAKLNVPFSTVEGSSRFLDFAQIDDYGTGYAYTPDAKANYRPSTSAVGLLCRMYLGWKKDNQGLIDGTARIAERGPSANDFYYNYYAAQLIFQMTNGTGPMWREWNTKLRDYLVQKQDKQGHQKGSWYVDHGHDTDKGGRLYCTALACMTLEVYYRHMPLYQTDAVDMEFPE
jgi:hypothetical protein